MSWRTLSPLLPVSVYHEWVGASVVAYFQCKAPSRWKKSTLKVPPLQVTGFPVNLQSEKVRPDEKSYFKVPGSRLPGYGPSFSTPKRSNNKSWTAADHHDADINTICWWYPKSDIVVLFLILCCRFVASLMYSFSGQWMQNDWIWVVVLTMTMARTRL
jgi:hypothetical protein